VQAGYHTLRGGRTSRDARGEQRQEGLGTEWFIATRDKVTATYERIIGDLVSGAAPQAG
jgi:hypothetical protein